MASRAHELRALPIDERFWAQVDKRADDECWPWVGAFDSHGYGHFRIGGRRRTGAHRFSYQLLVGPIPSRFQIDHLCRNPACVNPAHLEAVTRRVNAARGVGFVATNMRKTHCKNGHEFTPENTYWRVHEMGEARGCRACTREAQRRYQARKLAAAA